MHSLDGLEGFDVGSYLPHARESRPGTDFKRHLHAATTVGGGYKGRCLDVLLLLFIRPI